jgi:riboflavin biosynthesis pyrimidine reductase
MSAAGNSSCPLSGAAGTVTAVAADGSAARPRVIVSVTATADGRVTLSRAERLLDPGAARRWRSAWPPDTADLARRRDAAIARHHPTVVLEGSGTFVGDDDGPLDLPDTAVPPGDFRPHGSATWFAVVDRRGRIPWTHTEDGGTRLVVLVSTATPQGYLAELRRRDIPYLVADDLGAAVRKLGTHLGAGCVVSEAGGGLNGALLRAGLVDELHVVTVPALIGGLGTPSVFDGPALPPGSPPVRLRTVEVTVGEQGSVWSWYEVSR